VELRQLVYFEAVVRHGGFSHASRKLHVAQPAVSAQIQRLETELGVQLLHRTTRRVALTEAGELFLTRVRTVLQQLDQARSDLAELTGVLHGRVRIGATPVLGPLKLPASLAAFHRRYPGVTLVLRTGLIAELCAALDRGDLDIVLGPVHEALTRGHTVHRIGEETVVLVTPAGTRFTGPPAGERRPAGGRQPIDLALVGHEPFVCLPEGTGLRAMLADAATRAGFVPRVDFEANTPASVREMVAAGLGVALLAESAAIGPGPAVDVHPIRDAPRHPPIGSIRRRDQGANPAVAAFQKHLVEDTSLRGGLS
jgi:LysR family transcriptional regulator, transcription activator of glutamate synthase operon